MRRQSLALALLLVPAVAMAHTGDVRRQVMIEPAGDRLQVLVHLEITGLKRKRAIALLADQNHDGKLSKAERKSLESLLAVRALDGIRLIVGTATVTLEGAKSALSFEDDLPTALMILGTTPLSRAVDRIAVRTDLEGDPLVVVARPGTRPVQSVSRGRVEGGAFSTPLGIKDRVFWRIGPDR